MSYDSIYTETKPSDYPIAIKNSYLAQLIVLTLPERFLIVNIGLYSLLSSFHILKHFSKEQDASKFENLGWDQATYQTGELLWADKVILCDPCLGIWIIIIFPSALANATLVPK